MKRKFTLLLFAAAAFAACSRQQSSQPANAQTPKPLQENKSMSESFVSKRAPDNLLEELYQDLLTKDKSLNELDKMVHSLDGQQKDSSAGFHAFDGKNESYFSNASGALDNIKNSLLKQKINTLLEESMKGYEGKVSKHKTLLAAFDQKSTSLADLYTALKVVKTIPVIESYQKENLPSAKPLEQIAAAYDKAIGQVNKQVNN
ncbi:MAG: hypothetical protein QM687_03570 [Ferruginibacter sp.]